MADFVAVLRKTIGGLSDNTPEMREKVYDKARSTIEAKIAALNPQPPLPIIDRQRKALEDAIAVLRADYDKPVDEDDFDDIIASLDGSIPLETHTDTIELSAEQPSPQPFAAPVTPAPVTSAPVSPRPAPAFDPAVETRGTEPAVDSAGVANDDARDDDRLEFDTERRQPSVAAARHAQRPATRAGTSKGLIAAAAIALLVIAGGLYAVWPTDDAPVAGTEQAATPPPTETPVTTAEELAEAEPQPETAPEEVAVLPPPETPAPPAPAPVVEADKFTQRLMPDGNEVDEGPAGGQRTIGEGTSVAAVATPGDETAPLGAPPAAQTETTPPVAPTATGEQPAIAVGQRAIFYEERTSSSQGSAESGSIVWSVVQESPGGDQPPEPAIRAEATIPANDVRLRMTIRRNGDQTLPAGHIVEMIFLTPEGFEGGAISSVSRIAFKETEQAAGNPLLGIPAKIADGFFLIALSDAPKEMETNLQLLGQRSWIDIPIVYQSGRRALLSLEKGIPGERVFQDALDAWRQAASAG